MLKRDVSVIKQLKQVGTKLVASSSVTIQIPVSLLDKKLVIIEERTYIIGSFALIHGDRYCVWSAMAMYEIIPSRTQIIDVNGVSYYEFGFDSGDTVIADLNIIQDGNLVYSILQAYMFYGKVPWYYKSGDITKLLSTSAKYSGLAIDKTPEVIELLESIMSRLDTDTNVLIKSAKLSPAESAKRTVYIPLKDVSYLQNTLAQILGNYQSKGLNATLVAKPNAVGAAETIIRA